MALGVEAKGVSHKGYSQVAITRIGDAGSLIFLSGQVAMDAKGEIVGEGDFGVQCNFVYQSINDHLESVGSGMNRVLKMTAFLKDFDDYATFVGVRKKWFDPEAPPASTAVAVSGLVDPRLLLEIEVVAAGP